MGRVKKLIKLKPAKVNLELFSVEKGFGTAKPEAVRLVKNIISIFDDFKIDYFLISGTLLGYVRHQDFIPWDDDIDILVDRKIFDLLPQLINNYEDIVFLTRENSDIVKVCFKGGTKITGDRFGWSSEGDYCWPFVDLWPFDVHEGKIKFFKKMWKKSEFFPNQKVEFLGINNVNIPKNPDYFLKINYGQNYMTEFISSDHCHKLDSPYEETTSIDFRSMINSGVDVKILQYAEYAVNRSEDQINLQQLINTHLLKKDSPGNHCVLINLEKDVERYQGAIKELNKVSIFNFVHLKGTYWKNRSQLQTDLNFIKSFLRLYNENVNHTPIEIDEFSTINDSQIHIQDGPLACLVSHIRGLIYGYSNFNDYTIIVEDDACVTNTENIAKYLKEVPDDWDVICLNARSKNETHTEPFYKFNGDWHSTHFYIVNHKCLPFLFKHFYPITDQIDVLISDQTQKLNIYNIADTVYQRNITTNTQNNLHVIFNSPHYSVIRAAIATIEKMCLFYLNKLLPDNENNNKHLVLKLMYDIVFNYITKDGKDLDSPHKEDYQFDDSEFKNESEYQELIASLEFFLQCSKKGIVPRVAGESLARVILYTILKFTELHNTIDVECGLLKAYDFGASAHVYLAERHTIVKQYNQKLRWTAPGHETSQEVFDKEIDLLRYWNLLKVDKEKMQIRMRYWGESLYRDFKLPSDWRLQLKSLFKNLDEMNIHYPEFRLQNITVLHNQIYFIDYGLASRSEVDNTKNCQRFISILEKCEQKFEGKDQRTILQLYSTLERNLEL